MARSRDEVVTGVPADCTTQNGAEMLASFSNAPVHLFDITRSGVMGNGDLDPTTTLRTYSGKACEATWPASPFSRPPHGPFSYEALSRTPAPRPFLL